MSLSEELTRLKRENVTFMVFLQTTFVIISVFILFLLLTYIYKSVQFLNADKYEETSNHQKTPKPPKKLLKNNNKNKDESYHSHSNNENLPNSPTNDNCDSNTMSNNNNSSDNSNNNHNLQKNNKKNRTLKLKRNLSLEVAPKACAKPPDAACGAQG